MKYASRLSLGAVAISLGLAGPALAQAVQPTPAAASAVSGAQSGMLPASCSHVQTGTQMQGAQPSGTQQVPAQGTQLVPASCVAVIYSDSPQSGGQPFPARSDARR